MSDCYNIRELDLNTYDDSTGAGDGGLVASIAGPDADNADGAAGETEEDVQVTEVDADGLQDFSAGGGGGLQNHNRRISISAACIVHYYAHRNGACATSISGRASLDAASDIGRCGDRKKGESESGESSETREHVV